MAEKARFFVEVCYDKLNLIMEYLMKIKQIGATSFVITIILMVAALLIMLYASQNTMLQQKSSGNQLRASQAFEAAEAGLEFGISYLNANTSTVIASPSGGYINYGSANSSLTNVALANSSRFSVVYTNPTQNNYQLLQVTSTGVNSDGTSTRVVRQQVYQQSRTFNYSVFSAKNVTFVGGSTLTNTVTNQNISTGGTLTINNGAYTITSTGQTTTQGSIGSDVQQNVPAYQGLSASAFFQLIFGSSTATVQSAAQSAGYYYSNQGPDYSQTLSGIQGQTIYINQTNGSTVSLGQGVTIGSSTKPVTIIVQGNLSIANGVRIYGFVYSSGPTTGFQLAGGARIDGGIASAGTMNISNGFQLVYNQFPLLAGSSNSPYAKVAGSWRDF